MKYFIIVLLVAFIVNKGYCQTQWEHIGLDYETITSLAIDPTDDNIIYAGSFKDIWGGSIGGLYRTTNGGKDWQTLFDSVSILKVAIAPSNHNIIYVSGRYSIVKSIDGGGTWARCDSGFEFDWELGPLALSINPQDPDIVLCSTGGPMGGNFYRTTNGGKRWTVVTDSTGVTVGGIYGITYDIENPNLVFASDYYFGHFYISYDGGIVWYMRTRYIGGATTILFNNEDQTLYLASLHGMYKSADTGKTWISIMNGIPGTRSGPYTVAIKENNTLFIGGFATDDSSFARFGVYRSGKSEVFWNFIGLDSERINTLIVTKNGNFLYAGANESGYDTRRGVYRLSLLTGIEERKDYVPENIFLNSYPNPFNNSITITYSLPVTLEIGISIYNILGRKVSTLLHAMQYSGDHAVRWDGTDALGNTVPSGMYFIFFETFEEKKSPSLKPLMKKILYVR